MDALSRLMFRRRIVVAIICFFSFVLITSCDADVQSINSVQSSDCKNFSKESFSVYSTDQECIEYEYVMRSALEIKHISARFNCCPGEFIFESRIKGDSILVKESTTERNCLCTCPYDLEYRIENITPGKYIFKIDRKYPEGYEKLIFEMNLTEQTSGVFCIGSR